MKLPHGEFGEAKLTGEEYAKLIVKFGKSLAEEKIADLDAYLASIGRRYKSHYATILNWDRMAKRKKGGAKPVYTNDFLMFWDVYRRKEAKGYAWQAWQAIDSSLYEKVITAAAAQSKSWALRGTEIRFIPLPASWLEGRYYENEAPASRSSSEACVICGKQGGSTVKNKWICSMYVYEPGTGKRLSTTDCGKKFEAKYGK